MNPAVAYARRRVWLAVPLLAGLSLAPPAPAQDQSAYQRIWNHARLYESGDGPVRAFDLSGRLQADGAWYDADEGSYDDLRWRRFRFGFTAQFGAGWHAQLEGDFDLNESPSHWYNRLTDASVSWNPDAALDLRILKHSAGFTLDGATSSKKLLTPERNNLTHNLWFTEEYFTGISAQGVVDGRWHYRAGLFSADGDQEISVARGGVFALTSLGYDWALQLGIRTALARIDYVHNREDEDNNTPDFADVASLVTKWEQGRWALWTDLSAGRGYFEQSDIWGAVVMPMYSASELLQWVLRYTWLHSADDNGLKLNRYEREVVGGRGDEYNEAYAGVNLFFYGHRLKWQTGVQYARMDDAAHDGGAYRGWGLTTALRAYW